MTIEEDSYYTGFHWTRYDYDNASDCLCSNGRKFNTD